MAQAYYSPEEIRGMAAALGLAEGLHWFAEIQRDLPRYLELLAQVSRQRGKSPAEMARFEDIIKTGVVAKLTKRETK